MRGAARAGLLRHRVVGAAVFVDNYAAIADGNLAGRAFGTNTGLTYRNMAGSGLTAATVSSGQVTGASREWAAVVPLGSSDQDISLTFVPGGAENGQPTDYTDIRVRVGGVNDGNFILFQVTNSSASVYRFNGGANQGTLLTTNTGASAGVAHVMRLRAVGTTVQAWLDGVSLGTATNTDTGTAIGFHNYALGARYLQFGLTGVASTFLDTGAGSGAISAGYVMVAGNHTPTYSGSGYISQSASGYAWLIHNNVASDMDVSVDIKSSSGSEDVYVALRADNPTFSNFLMMKRPAAGGAIVLCNDAQTVTYATGTVTHPAVTDGSFHTYRVVVTGTSCDVYMDGTKVIAGATVPAATSGHTYAGFLVNTTQQARNVRFLAAPNPPTLKQQVYDSNGTAATSRTVSLPAGVSNDDTAVLVVYEYPASQSVTAVSGLGATWTQATRVANAGNTAMSVWVGKGCVAAAGTTGTDVTVTSNAGQTNEMSLSTWSPLAGDIVGNASSQNTAVSTVLTGSRTTATGRLVIGGVLTNTTPTITWTDAPSAWTALSGSTDFFPAYKVTSGPGTYSRSGATSIAANYVGEAVEIA